MSSALSPDETHVTVLSPLVGQTCFLISMHSEVLGVDTRLAWEKKQDLKEFLGFYLENGQSVHILHEQDCSEGFMLLDMEGDIQQLVGGAMVVAEESRQDNIPARPNEISSLWGESNGYDASSTWSFFRFATPQAGYVTVRFYGESNGYYSETADCRTGLAEELLVLALKAEHEKAILKQGLLGVEKVRTLSSRVL